MSITETNYGSTSRRESSLLQTPLLESDDLESLVDEEISTPGVSRKKVAQIVGPLLLTTSTILRAADPSLLFKLISRAGIGAGVTVSAHGYMPDHLRRLSTRVNPISVEILQVITLAMLNTNWLGNSDKPAHEVLTDIKSYFGFALETHNVLALFDLKFRAEGVGPLLDLPERQSAPRTRNRTYALMASAAIPLAASFIGAHMAHIGPSLLGRSILYAGSIPAGLLTGDMLVRQLSRLREEGRSDSLWMKAYILNAKIGTIAYPVILATFTTLATRNDDWFFMSPVGIIHGATLFIDHTVINRRTIKQFEIDLVHRLLRLETFIGNAGLLAFSAIESFADPQTEGDKTTEVFGAFLAGLYGTYAVGLGALGTAHRIRESLVARETYFLLLEHRIWLPLMYIFLHGEVKQMNNPDIEKADSATFRLILLSYMCYGAQFGQNRVLASYRAMEFLPMLFHFMMTIFVMDQLLHALEG